MPTNVMDLLVSIFHVYVSTSQAEVNLVPSLAFLQHCEHGGVWLPSDTVHPQADLTKGSQGHSFHVCFLGQ